MRKIKNKHCNKSSDCHHLFNKKDVSLIFLGVGFTMFLLNITTYIKLLPYITYMETMGVSVLTGYYTSIISAIVLLLYASYNVCLDND